MGTFGRTLAGGAIVLALVGALAGACSSKALSSARVDGTVARTGLSARTAIAHGGLGLGIQIKISTKLNTCDSDHELGAVELVLTLPSSSLVAGTYDAGSPGGQVEADFRILDGTCTETVLRQATGGTVTVTSQSGNTLAGTFDLHFGDDHIGGEFSAYLCPDATGEAGLPFGPTTAAVPSAGNPLGRLDGGVVNDPEAGVSGDVGDASAASSSSSSSSSTCQP